MLTFNIFSFFVTKRIYAFLIPENVAQKTIDFQRPTFDFQIEASLDLK